ncbi:MAG: radical SAM protein [Selenomonadaceae bacterium]
MRDRYGREIEYMRISLTEDCNLHCSYCRPETALPEGSAQMTTAEVLRLCRIFAEIGVRKFKLTGGEPLLRRDLCQLIAGIKQIEGVEQVTLTTNGVLLGRKIDDLLAAGIDVDSKMVATYLPAFHQFCYADEYVT